MVHPFMASTGSTRGSAIRESQFEFVLSNGHTLSSFSRWPRFSVESALGDVRITGVEGRTARLHVEIFEYTPDDLRVELGEDGRLVFKSEGGHPGAIGEIIAELPADLSLDLSTGAGDVELKGMRGPRIEIETGLGDVTLDSKTFRDQPLRET